VIPDDAVEARNALYEIVEDMVRSVFLDAPEGVSSADMASNVTRAVWDGGYRKARPMQPPIHNHMTRDVKPAGKCPGCDMGRKAKP